MFSTQQRPKAAVVFSYQRLLEVLEQLPNEGERQFVLCFIINNERKMRLAKAKLQDAENEYRRLSSQTLKSRVETDNKYAKRINMKLTRIVELLEQMHAKRVPVTESTEQQLMNLAEEVMVAL